MVPSLSTMMMVAELGFPICAPVALMRVTVTLSANSSVGSSRGTKGSKTALVPAVMVTVVPRGMKSLRLLAAPVTGKVAVSGLAGVGVGGKVEGVGVLLASVGKAVEGLICYG